MISLSLAGNGNILKTLKTHHKDYILYFTNPENVSGIHTRSHCFTLSDRLGQVIYVHLVWTTACIGDPFRFNCYGLHGESGLASFKGRLESATHVKVAWNCLLQMLAFSFLTVLTIYDKRDDFDFEIVNLPLFRW